MLGLLDNDEADGPRYSSSKDEDARCRVMACHWTNVLVDRRFPV